MKIEFINFYDKLIVRSDTNIGYKDEFTDEGRTFYAYEIRYFDDDVTAAICYPLEEFNRRTNGK